MMHGQTKIKITVTLVYVFESECAKLSRQPVLRFAASHVPSKIRTRGETSWLLCVNLDIQNELSCNTSMRDSS